MKKVHIIIMLVAMTLLAGCTETYFVTSRQDLIDEVNNTRTSLEKEGYRLTALRTSSGTVQVAGVSMGLPSYKDSYTSQDTYKFVNDNGETLAYSVAYQNRIIDTIPFVAAVQVCECETSNPSDYDKLCGKDSPVDNLNNIKQTQEIQVTNVVKTTIAITAGLAVALVPLLLSIFAGK